MKKRIVSFILVIVMAVLALSSCAYDYAKKDLGEFNSIDLDKLKSGLKDGLTLLIDDGDFGLDEDERAKKVKDKILTSLAAIATEKYTEGTVDGDDKLAYCYYATATIGGKELVFYADKMQESKASAIQLGLTTLEGFDKVLAENVVGVDVTNRIYNTNTSYVANGDQVLVTYTESYKYGEGDNAKTVTEKVTYALKTVGAADLMAANLAGKKVGATYGFSTAGEKRIIGKTEYTVDVTYTDVVVDKIFKTKDEGKVAAGDNVYITYTVEDALVHTKTEDNLTVTIPADTVKDDKSFFGQLIGAEVGKELSIKAIVNGNVTESYTKVMVKSITGAADGDKVEAGDRIVVTYEYKKSESEGKKTYTNTTLTVPADAKADGKSFPEQLVGKAIGSTISINPVETAEGDGTRTVTYTSVKVNWVVETKAEEITFTHITYPKADNEKAVNATATDGSSHDLRDVELTYHVLPVYFNSVKALDAYTVLDEFYSAVASFTEEEHEDGEEHEKTYDFSSVQSGNYKNGEDTLLALVEALSTLQSELATAEKATSSKLTALKTAADAVNGAEKPTTTQNTNLTKAKTEYNEAVNAEKTAKDAVDKQIEKILKCVSTNTEDAPIADALVADYSDYVYGTLEDAYEDEIVKALAKAIYTYGKECLGKEFKSLPRQAVLDAYDRIKDSHKTKFYAKPTSGSSTETEYKKCGGDFDLYLKKVYFPEEKNYDTLDMQRVRDAIGAEAEKAVEELIYVYALAKTVSKIYGEDLLLTKEEKKDCKTQAEQMEMFYMYYLGSTVDMDVNDYIHAAQLDKVLDFLLEVNKDNEEMRVDFVNIKYGFKSDKDDAQDSKD